MIPAALLNLPATLRQRLAAVLVRADQGACRDRYLAVDVARGCAMVLMVFRHSWAWLLDKNLLDSHRFSGDWWICLCCRPSVPLFFMGFGFMLSYVYRNKTARELRSRLFGRALQVFLVYKLLYICEMLTTHASWHTMWEGLTYQRVSVTVEALNFYVFMLVLSPWLIPAWNRLKPASQVLAMVTLGGITAVARLDDWVSPVLQALLVGRAGLETFELVPHAITFLVGVTLGYRCRSWTHTRHAVRECLAWSALFLVAFVFLFDGHWKAFDEAMVFYEWKHPVALSYLCFTTALALLVIAAAHVWKGSKVLPASRNSPLEVLGRHALMVYFLHWMVIYFVVARWLHQASPTQARAGAALVVLGCWVWSRLQEALVARLAPLMAGGAATLHVET